jgi:hypothetical protein
VEKEKTQVLDPGPEPGRAFHIPGRNPTRNFWFPAGTVFTRDSTDPARFPFDLTCDHQKPILAIFRHGGPL